MNLSDDQFVEYGRRLLSTYQAVSRGLHQVPNFSSYQSRRIDDIRGFYFLSRIDDLEQKLGDWASLDNSTQVQWREWLIGECINSYASQVSCESELSKAISSSSVAAYHKKYLPGARSKYGSFFRLQNPRLRDVVWSGTRQNIVMSYFSEPTSQDVTSWLQKNIEEEWQSGDFRL